MDVLRLTVRQCLSCFCVFRFFCSNADVTLFLQFLHIIHCRGAELYQYIQHYLLLQIHYHFYYLPQYICANNLYNYFIFVFQRYLKFSMAMCQHNKICKTSTQCLQLCKCLKIKVKVKMVRNRIYPKQSGWLHICAPNNLNLFQKIPHKNLNFLKKFKEILLCKIRFSPFLPRKSKQFFSYSGILMIFLLPHQ